MSYQARQYALALFEHLPKRDQLDQALFVLREIKHAYEGDNELRLFFDDPNRSFADKKTIVEQTVARNFSDTHHVITNTILLMTRNNDLYKLSKTIYILKTLRNTAFNITEIHVETAMSLNAEHEQQLVSNLRSTDTEEIELKQEVQPSLLAGIVVRTEDYVKDLSIKGKLVRLSQS
jgi:F-type H+-transporting ATPase subunit delta